MEKQPPRDRQLNDMLRKLRLKHGNAAFWRAIDAMPRSPLDAIVVEHRGPGRKRSVSEYQLTQMALLMASGMRKRAAAREVLRAAGVPEHLLENKSTVLERNFGTGKVAADRIAAAKRMLEVLYSFGSFGRELGNACNAVVAQFQAVVSAYKALH